MDVTRRMVILGLLASPAGLIAAPKAHRLGWLSREASTTGSRFLEEVQSALERLGYHSPTNLRVDARFAGGERERLPALASELVALKPDAIVAVGVSSTKALREATATIPIVMAAVADAVAAGFVDDLGRPKGNVTGPSGMLADTVLKPLQILRDIAPGIHRVAVLTSNNPLVGEPMGERLRVAAGALDLKIFTYPVDSLAQIQAAFASMAREKTDGLFVIGMTATHAHRGEVVRLAASQRIPAIYTHSAFADAGGLASYATELDDAAVIAGYVDRIFKGQKPGDLAVQQPSAFELTLNQKAARALGITFPRHLQLTANRIID